MDIKFNSTPIISSLNQRQTEIKSDNTTEREGSGQNFYQKQKKKKEKMSAEQFQQALAKLNQKDFMKEMSWTASIIIVDDIQYAEVRNPQNEIIRTISEFDMWELLSDTNADAENKGHLLNKVA